jgi:hypothetical protein
MRIRIDKLNFKVGDLIYAKIDYGKHFSGFYPPEQFIGIIIPPTERFFNLSIYFPTLHHQPIRNWINDFDLEIIKHYPV